MFALTWDICTVVGRDAIVRALEQRAGRAGPGSSIAPDRTAPRRVMRAGTGAVEAIFRFETAQGRGSGVVRLVPDVGDRRGLKAWTLLTSLDELKGFEADAARLPRPGAKAYSRDFRGPQLARRSQELPRSHTPTAIRPCSWSAAGQAGLSIAARLAQLEVDTLIVET